jgi:hypothetical protein
VKGERETMKRLLFAALVLASCTDEERTVSVLRKQGFTEIRTTGYEFGACSEDDTYHTGFTAKNPQGQQVSGVVCCGLVFKNCTVRW